MINYENLAPMFCNWKYVSDNGKEISICLHLKTGKFEVFDGLQTFTNFGIREISIFLDKIDKKNK